MGASARLPILLGRFDDCAPEARPDTGCKRQKHLPLVRMSRQIAPRGLAGFVDIARAAARHEVALRLVTACTQWLDMVERQFLRRKYAAAVHTPAGISLEKARTGARARLRHMFYYTDGRWLLPLPGNTGAATSWRPETTVPQAPLGGHHRAR